MGGRTTYYNNFACRPSYGFTQVSGSDEKVKVTSNDTTTDYLLEKLVAGPNITITEQNDGGEEKIVISASVDSSTIDDYITCIAGETISTRDAVYVEADGLIYRATAIGVTGTFDIGFAISGALSGANIPVDTRHGKLMDGFSGLTVGARYFLSESFGQISTEGASQSGSVIYQVGIAKKEDSLLFYPELLVCNFG